MAEQKTKNEQGYEGGVPEHKKVSSGDVSGQGRERRDDDVMKGDRGGARHA